MTLADSVRRLEMQNFRFTRVLMFLAAESCRSRVESVHLLKPYLQKGLKEFQLCDSRRLHKKPQDAQDDVTELFDLFDVHFWVGEVYRIWTSKGGPPQYFFFSVLRLLGSRQVVTQCLCH